MQGFLKAFVIVVLIHLIIIGGVVLSSRKKSDDGGAVADAAKSSRVEESPAMEEKATTPTKVSPRPPANKIRFPLKGHSEVPSNPKGHSEPVKAVNRPVKVNDADKDETKKAEASKAAVPPKKVPVKIGKRIEPGQPEKVNAETPKRTPVKIGKRVEKAVADESKVEAPKKVPVKIGRRVGDAKKKPAEVKQGPTISEQIKSRENELDLWLNGRERVPVQSGQAQSTGDESVYNY